MVSPNGCAHFVIPLDVEVIVQLNVAGLKSVVTIGDRKGELLLPTASDAETLRPPLDAEYPEGVRWGNFSWRPSSHNSGQIAVSALAFRFPLSREELPVSAESLPGGVAGGLESIQESLLDWTARFVEMAGAILGQPLTLLDPSPLSLKQSNSTPVRWVEKDGRRSQPNYSWPLLIGSNDEDTPWAERAGDVHAVQRMAGIASRWDQSVPSAVLLVSAARRAAQRGRSRIGMVDLGTAAEALLTDSLKLGSHRKTLGMLVDEFSSRLSLPADVKERFVYPRNAAVHKNIDPKLSDLDYALRLMDELISCHYSEFAYCDHLPLAARPQKFEIIVSRS